VAFVHSCFFVGFLCGVCPQLFKDKQLWTKRHRENQQKNNCGQTSHRKPTDKQLWTNATQKTNKETTVDKGFCDVCPQLFVC
jgi:hypothetical protein